MDEFTLSQSPPPKSPGAEVTRPHLFLVLEADRPLVPPGRYSLAELDTILLGRGPERSGQRIVEAGARQLTLRVPDRWMSSTHAKIFKAMGRWVIEDSDSKNGTVVNGSQQKRAVLADGDLLELGHTFFLFRDAVPTEPTDPQDVEGSRLGAVAPGLATLVLPLARTFTALSHVAESVVSVVLFGESGTGKEVVARVIHQLSGRSGSFVGVNCGALPETLVETELFGYKKGAFSGAVDDRPGLIRSADHGTLFLDEIGDLPSASQAAFLRALQEREVVPVGATRPIPVDFRLIAATHRSLEQLVAEGKFRNDLFARISGFTLELPRLSDRREDLGLLLGSLLKRISPETCARITLTPAAVRALFRYDWPLNVRELEKCIGTAVVLAGSSPVDVAHLPDVVRAALDTPLSTTELAAAEEEEAAAPLTPEDEQRREELVALLRQHRGNISAVARDMGKARMQIQRWIKRFQLDPASYRR